METVPSSQVALTPKVRKFIIVAAALVVVLVSVALIRRKSSVSLPVS